MSSQRVIQDSDDESGDNCSDVATSIDPLQDPSLLDDAPSASNECARRPELVVPASIPESDLPPVDFNRYLRSESSIIAGDYEDERWVSTADAVPTEVQANREYRDQRQDDSFIYTANAGYVVPDTLPSTADMGRVEPQQLEHGKVAEDRDHPSKRRKISLTQDTLQEQQPSGDKSEVGASYNYFASFDPHGPSQAATELRASLDLPRQAAQDVGGGQEHVPERFETPPPTVPFSEDVLHQYDQDRAKHEPPPTTINESEVVEMPVEQGTALEADNDMLGSKKKRGRPKKQAPADKAEDQVELISDETVDQVDQTSKKKPGRPKEHDRDTSPDELAMDEMMKLQAGAISKPDKPTKKKVKRSKTTSDLPNTTSLPNADRDVLWINNSMAIDLESTVSKSADVDEVGAVSASKEEVSKKATGDDPSITNNTKAEPKKRGRKKKSTTEGPPAGYVESSTVLQDISNTTYLPTNGEKDPNDEQIQGTGTNEIGEVEPPRKGIDTAETPIQTETTPAKVDEESSAVAKQVPAKHSPIPGTGKVPYRVGLSRRARIAPLLKIVRK